MKKIAIWGFGITGQATLRYFLKSPKYNEYQIDVYDSQSADSFGTILIDSERVNYYFDTKDIAEVSNYEILLVSPSISKNHPVIQEAYTAGVKVCNDTMIFIEEFKDIGKIVGVTGSNGKSTVASLIHDSLKILDKKTILVGNIGLSPLDYLIDTPEDELKDIIAVLELSSFQLEIFDINHFVDIAIITNISPNHLDRHNDDIQEYADVKMKIFNQNNSHIVTVYDDPGIQNYILPKINSNLLELVSLDQLVNNQLLDFINKNFVETKQIKLPGKHNLYNVAIALKALDILGIEINNEKLINFIQNYKGLEHRIEFVRNFKGLDFYNDSKSTSPDATRVAIKSFGNDQKITLIMGGKDKNVSFEYLGPIIKNKVEKLIILSHEIDEKLIKLAEDNQVEYEVVINLQQAIDAAILNKNYAGLILFSPGSSSLGKFKNYEDRGEQFKDIVNRLK